MLKISQSAEESFILTPEVAYLVGVYLGDGYVDHHKDGSLYFQLSVIDEDFAKEVKRCAEVVIGRVLPSIKAKAWNGTSRTVYWFQFHSKPFCTWLEQVTNKKMKVPEFIPVKKCAVTKSFLEGLMDSEGWFSKSGKPQHQKFQYEVGFCQKQRYLLDSTVPMFQAFGITCRPIKMWTNKLGRSYFNLIFTVSTYISSGLTFHIQRKQQRIQFYLQERQNKALAETGS